jgi:hypothetical protein
VKRRRKRPKRNGGDEAHLDFIRSLPCCVPGCRSFAVTHPHHHRTAANSGTGLKPDDVGNTVPLCAEHHRELHDRGVKTFQAKHRIDLARIASELIERPPPGLM